jgi:hypothetical protein
MLRVELRLIVVLNLLAFLAVVAVNGLANALPINGRNTGEISGSLPNLFVPAGLTFSIWALIYLLLGIWSVWQLLVVFGNNSSGMDLVGRVGIWFLISSLANIAWILAWHYGRYPLSLILMLVILASLIIIYLRLDIGRSDPGTLLKFVTHLPFSVYLGWITIATVANLTAVLVAAGWNGFGIGEVFWAVALVAVAVIITLAVLLTRRDFGYALVALWALLGIILARLNGPNESRTVAIAAIAGAVIVLFGIIGILIFLKDVK